MDGTDYAERDSDGKIVAYVLLGRRRGLAPDLFRRYWHDVHGPLCAGMPPPARPHQYFQHHFGDGEQGLWPPIDGVDGELRQGVRYHGVAELTFTSQEHRDAEKQARLELLVVDENYFLEDLFSLQTRNGGSRTHVDRIPDAEPNGDDGLLRVHVLLERRDGVSGDALRRHVFDCLGPALAASEHVLKVRSHVFEDESRRLPTLPHAALELAFDSRLALQRLLDSVRYTATLEGLRQHVQRLNAFPVAGMYVFNQGGRRTLAGRKGSSVAALIEAVGAPEQADAGDA